MKHQKLPIGGKFSSARALSTEQPSPSPAASCDAEPDGGGAMAVAAGDSLVNGGVYDKQCAAAGALCSMAGGTVAARRASTVHRDERRAPTVRERHEPAVRGDWG
jgi:hypothetical protein